MELAGERLAEDGVCGLVEDDSTGVEGAEGAVEGDGEEEAERTAGEGEAEAVADAEAVNSGVDGWLEEGEKVDVVREAGVMAECEETAVLQLSAASSRSALREAAG